MTRILLVDDDTQVRTMLKKTFEREGYEVVEAGDGCQAVALYDPDTIDLVITDIVMPEKEGIETIREIKSNNPQAKIIAISGGGRIKPGDYLAWAERFGVDNTFTKPIRRQEILDAIEALVRKPVG
ncbi:MAG: response regulator [Candidatus Krumholzibacteriia bacterium]